jgi:hypothetical protein
MVTSNSDQSHWLETENKKRLQQYAHADFAYWSKMGHWKLDEAVALTFGKSPESFKWEDIKRQVRAYPFAKEYSRVRELASRAELLTLYIGSIPPNVFLAWAKEMEIDVPNELVELVEKHASLKVVKEDKGDSDSLPESERESLLKLVLGMAIDAYNHDPDSARNSATGANNQSISSCLARHNLELHPDTVRKYLNEARKRVWEPVSNPTDSSR